MRLFEQTIVVFVIAAQVAIAASIPAACRHHGHGTLFSMDQYHGRAVRSRQNGGRPPFDIHRGQRSMTYGPNASPLWQAREYRVRAVPASGGDNGADERSRWVAQPQPQPPFIFPSLPSNYEDSNNPSTRTSLRDSWQRDDDKSGKFSSPSTANNPRSLNDATEPLGTRVPPLSVDKRVLESTHMQQLVRFLLLAANRHDYPDQFAAEFRALAVHRLLRMVPRLDFLNEVQGLDTLDYYRMLKNEHMRVPLTLAKRAEVAVDAELRLLRWREVDGDPQGNAILAYKEQLLAEIRDDQAQYPSYCDKLVQDAAQQLCGKEHSVQHFEFILTMLNDLQQCDTVSSLAWDHEMIRENIIFDPWPLFHTAERYFDREHLPVSDRIRIMGQLAHAIFTLPRSSSDPARPWPMDITLILARYVHLMRPQDPDIPERFWLFYVFAVQLEYRHQYMDSPLFVEPAYVALAAFRRQMERVSVMDVGARLTMRLYNQWYARALGSTCGELEQEERPHGCDVPFEGEDMSFWLNPSDITGQSIRDDVNDDRDTAVTLSTIQLADYVKFVQQLQRLPGIDLQKESLRLAKHALHFGLVDSIIEFREHVFGWRAISGQ